MITNNIDLTKKTDEEVMALYKKLTELIEAKESMLKLFKLQDEFPGWILSNNYQRRDGDKIIIKHVNQEFNKAIIEYVMTDKKPKTMEELEKACEEDEDEYI